MSISLFLAAPVNIYICPYTFIRYCNDKGEEYVGQIVDIHEDRRTVSLRQFMTTEQLMHHFGENMLPNITYWPTRQLNHPPYLCAIDQCQIVPTNSINGLAFVLYYNDPVVRQVFGLANTFVVSSAFSPANNTLFHAKTFLSFPSLYADSQLVSCFPSMIFMQLLTVKEKLQLLLHSRSKNKKCMQSCTIPNIDRLTWEYMTTVLQVQYIQKNVVIKKVYCCNDEFHMEKYRALQFSTFLCLPQHLAMAQKLFGTAIGLGCRNILKCALKQRAAHARRISRQQIKYTDSLNVIPFQMGMPDYEYEEINRRGIELKYIPLESEFSITVKYRKLIGRTQIEPHLQMRNIVLPNDNGIDDDSYPFFANTDIFGSTISQINLNTATVILTNNERKSIQEVMGELDRLI